jgi:hypothetical protein
LAYQQPVFADIAALTAARRVGRGLYQLTSDQDATCRVRFHDRRFRNDVAASYPPHADHPCHIVTAARGQLAMQSAVCTAILARLIGSAGC